MTAPLAMVQICGDDLARQKLLESGPSQKHHPHKHESKGDVSGQASPQAQEVPM